MDLIAFLKNNFFLQNFVGWVASLLPPFIEHNLQKYAALRKAFFLTSLDDTKGDYLEFGVFTGNSFVFATRMHKRMRKVGAADKKSMRFLGFDSFQGFGTAEAVENHPFYRSETFKVNEPKVVSNIKAQTKGCEVQLVPGYFEQTIAGKRCPEFGVSSVRIAFIDCDLKGPARLCLDFVRDGFQPGSVLIMDDFFGFKGDPEKGVAGAFNEFCSDNSHIQFRRMFDYGYGGAAFIVSQIEGIEGKKRLNTLADSKKTYIHRDQSNSSIRPQVDMLGQNSTRV